MWSERRTASERGLLTDTSHGVYIKSVQLTFCNKNHSPRVSDNNMELVRFEVGSKESQKTQNVSLLKGCIWMDKRKFVVLLEAASHTPVDACLEYLRINYEDSCSLNMTMFEPVRQSRGNVRCRGNV